MSGTKQKQRTRQRKKAANRGNWENMQGEDTAVHGYPLLGDTNLTSPWKHRLPLEPVLKTWCVFCHLQKNHWRGFGNGTVLWGNSVCSRAALASTWAGFRRGRISAEQIFPPSPLRDPGLLMLQRFRLPCCSPKGVKHAESYQCKRENERDTDERLVDEHKLKKRPLICQLSPFEWGEVKGGTLRNIITYLPAEINYKLLSLADSSEACRSSR